MIATKPVNNCAKTEKQVADSEEKESKIDEFTALLDGLFSAPVPIDLNLQKLEKAAKTNDVKGSNQNAVELNSIGESSENLPLKGKNEQISPIEMKDFFKLDGKPEINILSKFKLEDKNNLEKQFDLSFDKNSDSLKTNDGEVQNSDANSLKDFEIINDEPATKTENILSTKNLFETAASLNNEKPSSTNKLPKLFGEVAGLLEVHNPNLSREQAVSETPPIAAAEKAFIEQIEPKLLELAGITMRTNEKQVLKMKLHPAELGMVEIRIEKDKNGKLTAHFQTESDAAKQILTENLEQLRDSLQNSGWQVEHLEISSDSSASSNSFENRENQSRNSETAENSEANSSINNGNSNHKDDLNDNPLSRLLSLRA